MIVDVAAEDAELLERFYRELYLTEFAHQREPLEAWQRALAGDQPYRMFVRLAVEHDTILGGITYEEYPASACGFITYVVVAPSGRRGGLGKRLVFDAVDALFARGARAVFGEMRDPRKRESGWERIERFQRWGCRIVDTRYVQPSLGPGLERDRELVLIAHPPLHDSIAGETVRAFIAELHQVTERREPDDELRAILDEVPEVVPLVELKR